MYYSYNHLVKQGKVSAENFESYSINRIMEDRIAKGQEPNSYTTQQKFSRLFELSNPFTRLHEELYPQ